MPASSRMSRSPWRTMAWSSTITTEVMTLLPGVVAAWRSPEPAVFLHLPRSAHRAAGCARPSRRCRGPNLRRSTPPSTGCATLSSTDSSVHDQTATSPAHRAACRPALVSASWVMRTNASQVFGAPVHGVPVTVRMQSTPSSRARSTRASRSAGRGRRCRPRPGRSPARRGSRASRPVARCAVSRMASTGRAARSGAVRSADAAASDWMAIIVISWPTTSCSSRAMRARSSATAACSARPRSTASSAVSRRRRCVCSRCAATSRPATTGPSTTSSEPSTPTASWVHKMVSAEAVTAHAVTSRTSRSFAM